MIIAISGTPGTGKTAVCARLRKDDMSGMSNMDGTGKYDIIDLNDLIISQRLYKGTDTTRGSLIVDMERLREAIKSIAADSATGLNTVDKYNAGKYNAGKYNADKYNADNCDVCIIEGHLSHLMADCTIVLRCAPEQLRQRLEDKGFNERKIQENLEAECVDVILIEATEQSKMVYEINTTHKTVDQVGDEVDMIIRAIISGDEEVLSDYTPGIVDFSMDIEYSFEGWQE